MELFLSIFGALFSVMNPLGTVPIFVSLTQDNSQSEINKTSLLASINVMVILFISFFIGKYVLAFFAASDGIVLENLRDSFKTDVKLLKHDVFIHLKL